jgi:CheY-like chemotaxis protein
MVWRRPVRDRKSLSEGTLSQLCGFVDGAKNAGRGMDDAHAPPPETILFVEDEPLVRMDMAEFLRQSGYRVSEAGNAAEATEILGSKLTIDLVLTDIQMPGAMDGLALARWIRENRPGVEVLIATGGAKFGEKAENLRDFGPVLKKPYTGRDLLARVREALSRRSSPTSSGAASA